MEQIEGASWIADFSPDGKWLAYSESLPDSRRGKVILRSRGAPEKRLEVPLILVNTGASCRVLWSGDSKSLLIAETGWNATNQQRTAYRLYDLVRDNVIELDVPSQYWPSDWSAPPRLLVMIRSTDGAKSGLAWVNVDGSGDPEYLALAGENEAASAPRVSPDGGRILCQIAPRNPPAEGTRMRLSVVELATGKRTAIDDPGQTSGYCWSPDGTHIAYTWQPALDRPENVNEREIALITCDANGGNRNVVTRRKHTMPPNNSGRSGYSNSLTVLDWR